MGLQKPDKIGSLAESTEPEETAGNSQRIKNFDMRDKMQAPVQQPKPPAERTDGGMIRTPQEVDNGANQVQQQKNRDNFLSKTAPADPFAALRPRSPARNSALPAGDQAAPAKASVFAKLKDIKPKGQQYKPNIDQGWKDALDEDAQTVKGKLPPRDERLPLNNDGTNSWEQDEKPNKLFKSPSPLRHDPL